MHNPDDPHAREFAQRPDSRRATFLLDEVFLECDAEMARILGVEAAELRGRDLLAISPPRQPDGSDSAGPLSERIAAARAGLGQSFAWRLLRGNRETVDVLLRLESARIDDRACLRGYLSDLGEHQRIEHALRNVALGVSGATDRDIFQVIVRYLAETLGVDFAYIGELSCGPPERINTLAVYMDGEITCNTVYDLANTPCNNVVGKQFYFVSNDVQSQYPGDNMLSRMNFEGYAAYPLFGTDGDALGLIAVVHRKPLTDRELTESILKIFSVRAAAELERRHANAARGRLEAQLRQTQKMEAIGHLTGGIAHDFNNILTAIMGNIVMAQEWQERHGDERLRRYLEHAQNSVQRARDLIQQMLTFSRGQHGEPRPLALDSVVGESLGLLKSTLPSSLEFTIECDQELPEVMADPVHIEQVLMNLCINARDAMQGSGGLGITLRPVDITPGGVCASCRKPLRGRYVELAVSDSGPGISPEVADRMFEPFFSTKGVGKGSGMGLSTVHGIVHEGDGHILLDTEPGTGSTFRILLPPLARASESAPDQARSEATGDAGDRAPLHGKVLLVDDDPDVREFMADRLSSWGLEVSVCDNAVEALDYFMDTGPPFDLLVLDQTMPKMTGTEFAALVLERFPDLPVILYTGYSDDLTEAHAQAIGIRALARKPLDDAGLYRLLEANLPGSIESVP
jgi:signal transduction histidine kinase/ActR/RegA family two-component response regulator